MRKITIVHNSYIHRGGEDVCVQNEADALLEAGIDVKTLIVQNQSGTDLLRQALLAPFGNRHLKEIEATLLREKPDVLHVHNLYPALSPRLIAFADSIGVPTVMTLHNYRPLCLNGLFLTPANETCERCAGSTYIPGIIRGCYRGSRVQSAYLAGHLAWSKHNGWYNAVRRYIAPSVFLRDKFIHYGFPKDRMSVQGHFLPRFSHHPPFEPEPYLLYLGRLSEEKGVRWLLSWAKNHPVPIPIHIAGDGPLKNEVVAAQSEKIRYLGYLSGEAKHNTVARAQALILPSTCYENFPLAVMEANQYGVPVLAPAIGGFVELVAEGENGFLYSPQDAYRALEALKRVLSIPGLTLRQQTQAYARRRFGKDSFLKARLELYQSVLAKRL